MIAATLWGTRGSLAAAGPDTQRYGGNTACVEVRDTDGTVLVLDAGTGIRRLGAALLDSASRVDLLLTHLHMDHIQGLGFFAPLFDPAIEVHLWGPPSTTLSLSERLSRYLSPPLFPVRLRDVPALHLHEVPGGEFEIGPFRVSAALVCHPNPTLGYRVEAAGASLAYLPDHEPALGDRHLQLGGEWTSGYDLAVGTNLLIHDAQYNDGEYESRVGWGHSSIDHTLSFAALAEVKHLVLFHHDPAHSDEYLDRWFATTLERVKPSFAVTPGTEGARFELGR